MHFINVIIFIIAISVLFSIFRLHLNDINLNDPSRYIEKIDKKNFNIEEIKEITSIEIQYSKKRENSIIRFGVFILGVITMMLGINLLIYDKEIESRSNRIEFNEHSLDISNKALLVIIIGILLALSSLFSHFITEYLIDDNMLLVDIKRRLG